MEAAVIELTEEMKAVVKRRTGVNGRMDLDPWTEAALRDVLAIVERDLRVPDAYVHVECGTAITWNAAMVREYGPIGEQGCDCENAWSLNWRPLYAGPPEPGGKP